MLIYIYHPGLHAPERAVEIAGRLEGLGYDGIAMPDHLFIPNFITGAPQCYAHGPTVLTTCAAVTSRIRLVTLMANLLVRPACPVPPRVARNGMLAGPRSRGEMSQYTSTRPGWRARSDGSNSDRQGRWR